MVGSEPVILSHSRRRNHMMKPGLLALALISITQLGAAATCGNGTLASYASLGSAGCTIGTNQLYDF